MADIANRVVIIGAGFGGMNAAKALADADADVTLIDRTNHHLFQPLLYQVATAALSPNDIAEPVRAIFRRQRNLTVLMNAVTGVDLDRRCVLLKTGPAVAFDYLVIATGSDYSLFGHDEWRPFVHVLKTLDDAMTMRDRLLTAFERAEQMAKPDEASRMLTFAIVGAGPTGVELAGTIAELARFSLAHDFRRVDPRDARIVLIEAGDRILSSFPKSLSRAALDDLTALGVEVLTGHPVEEITADHVRMGSSVLETEHVFWCAGVQARPSAAWIGARTAKNGAIEVTPDFSVQGRPDLFAIGDVARVSAPGSQPLPGLATVAEQQGTYVGRLIATRLAGSKPPPPFQYKDRGSLAVIGRSKAVGRIGSINLKGFAAWALWSLVHLWTLTGFRNRVAVYLDWSWAWVTHGRGDRIITSHVDPDVR